MAPITLTQGQVTATLTDVYFSPASAHVENGTAHVIESSISASANVVLANGSGILAYDDQTFAVAVTVLDFEEDGDDDVDDIEGDTPACHIMLDSAELELEKLADRLELDA